MPGTLVTISGANFGDSQGSSTVTFNGVAATVISWSNGTIVVRVPEGINPGTATVVVNVGSTPSNTQAFTITPPLFMSPSKMWVALGGTTELQVLDENGVVQNTPTWEVINANIAQVNAAADATDSGILQGLVLGTTKLIATVGNRTANGTANVYDATIPLPPGTVKWSTSPQGSDAFFWKSVQAVNSNPDGPDLYLLEGASSSYRVHAVRADGHQLWQRDLGNGFWGRPVAALNDGGLAVVFQNAVNGAETLIAIDPASGANEWQYAAQGELSAPAIHPDGHIFLTDRAGTANNFLKLDAATGAVVQTIPLPASQWTHTIDAAAYGPPDSPYSCTSNPDFSILDANGDAGAGNPSIGPDGTVYVELINSVRNIEVQTCVKQSDTEYDPRLPLYNGLAQETLQNNLQLFSYSPGGGFNITPLQQSTYSGQVAYSAAAPTVQPTDGSYAITEFTPGDPVPDSSSGVLLPFNRDTITSSNSVPSQRQLTRVISLSPAYTLSYPSPSAYWNAVLEPDVVVDDTGTAYWSDHSSVVALDIASGATKGSWSASDGSYVTIEAAQDGGGASISTENTDYTSSTLVRLDNTGTSIPPPTTATSVPIDTLDHFSASNWVGITTDSFDAAEFVGDQARDSISASPRREGNRGAQRATPALDFTHFLPIELAVDPSKYPIETYLSDARQAAPNPPSYHRFFLKEQATVDSFLRQLQKHQDVVAFLGHSFTANTTPDQSVGLCFFSDCLEKRPLIGEIGYPFGFPTPPPFDPTVQLVDPEWMNGDAKVIFIASCDDGQIFEELWGVYTAAPGRALIVPPSKDIDLIKAKDLWLKVLTALASGSTASQALAIADSTGTWRIIGDPSVKVYPAQNH